MQHIYNWVRLELSATQSGTAWVQVGLASSANFKLTSYYVSSMWMLCPLVA